MDFNSNSGVSGTGVIPNWNQNPWMNNQITPISTVPPPAIPTVTEPNKQQVKMIKSIDDVYPNEIPSDGSWGIFMLEDLSKIYLLSQTIEGIKRNEYCLKEPDLEVKLDMSNIEKMFEKNNEKMRQEMSRMISNAFKRNNNHNKAKGGTGNE